MRKGLILTAMVFAIVLATAIAALATDVLTMTDTANTTTAQVTGHVNAWKVPPDARNGTYGYVRAICPFINYRATHKVDTAGDVRFFLGYHDGVSADGYLCTADLMAYRGGKFVSFFRTTFHVDGS